MSEVKVNKISPRTGTDVELNSSAKITNFTSTGIDDNATSTAYTIESDGDIHIAKTSRADDTVGHTLASDGLAVHTRDGAELLFLNRKTSDGKILSVRKDNTEVGSIGANSSSLYIGGTTRGLRFTASQLKTTDATGNNQDNQFDLGSSTTRFKDFYLGGSVYLGGTGSANALDDYEEGTFSPTVEGSTTAGSVTYITREGFYTKVGNCVIFNIFVRWQSGTGAGNLKITGLPFTSYATTLHHAVSIGWMNDYNYTNGKIPRAYINNNATRINFEESTDNGSSTNLAYDSQAGLILSGSYQTN